MRFAKKLIYPSTYYFLLFVPFTVTATQIYQTLPEITVDDNVAAKNGSSLRLNLANIEQRQADNAGQLLDGLTGVSMAGSPNPGGQSLNIWGMQDSEDIRLQLDGNPKNFERYQQGSLFIEPELLRQVEIEKGAFSPRYGNGGGGGNGKFHHQICRRFFNR